MNEFPDTRHSLIARLEDAADHEAWEEFTDIYRPLVYRLARRGGLQDADAQDLTQRVLLSVARSIERWESDSSRARFRTWLYRIARNAIIDQFRSLRPDKARGGTTALRRLNESIDREPDWTREHRREIFRWAARRIRGEFQETTWRAFWLSAAEGRAIPDVAEQLGKSVGAIYIARSRVMQRLREVVRQHETDGEMENRESQTEPASPVARSEESP